jgi:hypothetical protein
LVHDPGRALVLPGSRDADRDHVDDEREDRCCCRGRPGPEAALGARPDGLTGGDAGHLVSVLDPRVRLAMMFVTAEKPLLA